MSTEKQRLDYLWSLYPCTFRHNVGQAWAGGKEFKNEKGETVIIGPQRVRYGLERGAADLIGYTSTIITPEMVGQKVAIFTSIEDKSEKDRISLEQIIWLLRTKIDGCISEVYKEGVKLSIDEIMELPRRDKDLRKEKIVERLYDKIAVFK